MAGSNWYGAAGDSAWVDGSDAVFGNGGAGGTVALAGSFSANSLTFQPVTSPYASATTATPARFPSPAAGSPSRQGPARSPSARATSASCWCFADVVQQQHLAVGQRQCGGLRHERCANAHLWRARHDLRRRLDRRRWDRRQRRGARRRRRGGRHGLLLRRQYVQRRHLAQRRHAAVGLQRPGAPAANIINYSANSSGLTLGGGTLAIRSAAGGGGNTQQFNGLALATGASTIQLDQNGDATPPTLNLGPIVATWPGSALLLDTSLGGTITTTTSLGLDFGYGGRVVYYDGNGYEWATTTSGAAPYTLSKAATTVPLPANGATGMTNYLVADGGSGVTASETVNTLKITTSGAGKSLAISAGRLLTLAGGGLLFTGGNDYTISGGSMTAGAGLIVQQYAANNNLTIGSAIVNYGSGQTTSLAKAGPGTLTLSAANTYTGGTSVLAGTLALTGTMVGPAVVVGCGGAANFTQSAGINAPTTLYLGYNPGSSGTYTLSGAGNLSPFGEVLGNAGTGSFTQSGGSNTVATTLYLGYFSGSTGTYTLSGGSLSASSQYVGNSGTGSFTQSGGSNTVFTAMYLGNSAGGSGSYSLSGTGLLSAAAEYVGYWGTGSFTQSGGSNTVSTSTGLCLGYQVGGSGSYLLSGGQLTAPTEQIGYGVGTPALYPDRREQHGGNSEHRGRRELLHARGRHA